MKTMIVAALLMMFDFACIGLFSAPFGFPKIPEGFHGLLGNPVAFAKQVKVFFISCETAGDLAASGTPRFHQELEQAGIKHVLSITGHRPRMADLAAQPASFFIVALSCHAGRQTVILEQNHEN